MQNIDVNAGSIIDGDKSFDDVAQEIVSKVLEVAQGKLTAPRWRAQEFALRCMGSLGCIY